MSVQIIEPKRIQIPAAFKDLETRTRYHSYRGGRGGAKSWAIARKLATLGATQRLRILCTRELQSSIKDSVHRLLSDQIDKIGFSNHYKIYRDTIVSNVGTEFIFKGLKHNVQEIKSLEGIDICWVEGTLIDGKKIETIKIGDFIQSYNHKSKKIELQKVTKVFKSKKPETLYQLIVDNKNINLIGTGNHPIYIKNRGYIPITEIKKGDIVYEKINFARESRLFGWLWRSNRIAEKQKSILQEIWRFVLRGLQKKTNVRKNEKQQSNEQSCNQTKNDQIFECKRNQTYCTWRKWSWCYKIPAIIIRQIRTWLVDGIADPDWKKILKLQSPNKLQDRFGKYILQIGNRVAKRKEARRTNWKRKRFKKGYVLKEHRVESIEIYEQGSFRQSRLSNSGDYVYNLEVEINNNYFANGILVHNCWVEEAQSTSEDSWSILIPTIRTGANWEESEIWLTWNTGKIDDPTYKRFVTNPPDDCITKKVGWQDNPFFPKVLEKERLYLQRVDIDAYNHIWEGEPLSISEAAIFKGKYVIEEFEAPKNTIFYYGADFGFAQDPSTLIRSYIQDNHLFIDYEAYGVGVETDELPQLYDSVPGSREWKIKGDRARPDTISYLKRHGFDIVAYTTKKIQKTPKLHEKTMAGDQVFIKEGLSYLKRFEKIHIHQRCRHAIDEFKLYSYKTDPQTNEILPIIVDKHNHIIDALRYSHDRRIHGGISWDDFIGT